MRSAEERLGTQVLAIGTAVPRYQASQEEAARFFKEVAAALKAIGKSEGQSPEAAPRGDHRGASPPGIDRLLRSTAIARRASVLPDFTEPMEVRTLFPANAALEPPPTTGQRMAAYEREAPRLAAQAAEACLAQAQREQREVTHLLVVSCTGFFAPGVDVLLARTLGLRRDVERQIIGFMGCYAAFCALRAADAICRADPAALVLVVCVELCTLHFQRPLAVEAVLTNALFSDGAAAALLASGGAGRLRLLDTATQLTEEDTRAQMTWRIIDSGFRMTLAASVPETLRREVAPFVDGLLARRGIARGDIAFWAVHPGGRRIVEVVGAELGAAPAALAPSYEVLAAHGNMSSATILFVLERWIARGLPPGALGVALAFGPGLTMEGALLQVPPGAARA